MLTLKESLNNSLNESTWMADNPGDLFKQERRTPQAFLDFMTDKGTKMDILKEIRNCEEDFSVEIPIECVKILGSFKYKDLQDAWSSHAEYKSDQMNFINNLYEPFNRAWLKDGKQIDNIIRYTDNPTELKIIGRDIDKAIKKITKNIDSGELFVGSELDISLLVKQANGLQDLLDKFHEENMKF